MKKSDVLKEDKRLKAVRAWRRYKKEHNYETKTKKTKFQKTLSSL